MIAENEACYQAPCWATDANGELYPTVEWRIQRFAELDALISASPKGSNEVEMEALERRNRWRERQRARRDRVRAYLEAARERQAELWGEPPDSAVA